jgi:uncharacterized membrane protein
VKFRWSQLGGQLGIGLALIGFVLIFLGWNGAASYDRVPAQFPYLISGAVAGLALVVLGAAMIVVQSWRRDRAGLQRSVDELRVAVERLAGTVAVGGNGSASSVSSSASASVPSAVVAAQLADGLVVAGGTSYHRPDCRLVDGRGPLPAMTVDAAEATGLTPCRACDAADAADVVDVVEPAAAATVTKAKAPARKRRPATSS